MMTIHLSASIPWSERVTLPTDPGIYVIAKEGVVIYIGKSWGGDGLRGRLFGFYRSATTGMKGHAGGVTFFGKFGVIVPEEIAVSVHVPLTVRRDTEILYPYIHYAERRLIWEHVECHGKMPTCNIE